MIPGDLLSAFPHRQFNTLPGLLDSWAALPKSYPNACMPMQGGSLYHFYDGLWYDPAERRTHDLPCERRTRYRLSQPDTVSWEDMFDLIFLWKSNKVTLDINGLTQQSVVWPFLILSDLTLEGYSLRVRPKGRTPKYSDRTVARSVSIDS